MSEKKAWEKLKEIRWSDNRGEPYCPRCGCFTIYSYATRLIWKCKGCDHQFSVTSRTILAGRKLPIRTYLLVIALFASAAKGISTIQASRYLGVSYKSAFVLLHKLREAIGAGSRDLKLSGVVETDGAWFGGYVKPANIKKDRVDRRRRVHRSDRRWSVVVLRERQNRKGLPRRKARTVTMVYRSEDMACTEIRNRLSPDSIIHADESSGWDILGYRFKTKRINHSLAYSDKGACTNQAESFFSRLRRFERGTHHRIAGPHLNAYATEAAWREDNRREPSGSLFFETAKAALKHPASLFWKGYWQGSARRWARWNMSPLQSLTAWCESVGK